VAVAVAVAVAVVVAVAVAVAVAVMQLPGAHPLEVSKVPVVQHETAVSASLI